MRATLVPHPDTPSSAVSQISVDIVRAGNKFSLRYEARGAIEKLALPARATAERTDELWKHTCFEAFARCDNDRYYEFNLSPSTQWAAYSFDSYRNGMHNAAIPAPHIETCIDSDVFILNAMLDFSALALPDDCVFALTAIIEGADGAKSYWALAHAPGKPDFHHADGFTLHVPVSGDV